MPSTDILPVTVPETAGVNTTVNAELCPGAKLVGNPLQVKPEPLILGGNLRLVLLFPVLDTIRVTEELLPSVTVPKSTIVGVIASWRLTVCANAGSHANAATASRAKSMGRRMV